MVTKPDSISYAKNRFRTTKSSPIIQPCEQNERERESLEMITALRSFLIRAIGFLVKPLENLNQYQTEQKRVRTNRQHFTTESKLSLAFYYLLRIRAGKSLTRSSVDMSRRASRSTPLKANFLNVLFFGTPAAATSGSTSAYRFPHLIDLANHEDWKM